MTAGPLRLLCATSNPGKAREFALAAGERVAIEPLPGFRDIPHCVEDGATFADNAIIKARHYGAHTPGLLFADDSGLEVDALGGAPGVHSARFAGPHSTDEANNRLVLERLGNCEQRTGQFVCSIALAEKGRLLQTFRGVVEGLILDAPRGPNGFGYDPLFYYPPFGCSFGEVTGDRKLTVSHRGRALEAMMEWLGK